MVSNEATLPHPARDYGRRQALHMAAMGGDAALVRLLLAHGAWAHRLDPEGHTPSELARKFGQYHLLPLLDHAAFDGGNDDDAGHGGGGGVITRAGLACGRGNASLAHLLFVHRRRPLTTVGVLLIVTRRRRRRPPGRGIHCKYTATLIS